MTNLTITTATKSDLPTILDVQKKAFLEVARVFHLKTLPPLEQTLESITEDFENGTILKAFLINTCTNKHDDTNHHITDKSASLDSRLRENDGADINIIGSVRAHQDGDTCFIGRLVVLPEYQNQGIGKALMHEIENQYKSIVRRYELFTGARDPRNRHLYDRLSYKPFKTEKLNDEVTFLYMEKMPS